MTMNRRRLLRRALLLVALLVMAATVVVFIGYRRATRNPDVLLDLVQKEADMQLKRIRQTATKNGIREWRLEAESATLLEKQQTMLLSRPDVEFFMQDGDNVHLTADQGTISTDSSRITVSGNVLANTSRYRFASEVLDYDPDTRELISDAPVTISGQSFTLNAQRMTMNLETNITRFEGGVEGTIRENLQL
jgi:LPS export ABC transporter protein LptC